MLIEAAHLQAYSAADIIDEAARDGRALSAVERARLRMCAAHTAESLVESVDLLMYAYGFLLVYGAEPSAAHLAGYRDGRPPCGSLARHRGRGVRARAVRNRGNGTPSPLRFKVCDGVRCPLVSRELGAA